MPLRHFDRFRRASAALVCLALLTACSPDTGPVPAIGVSLGAASVEVVRDATIDDEVTVSRVGTAHDAVVLDVTGLPGGVTATFAPAVLTGGALTSTLTTSSAAPMTPPPARTQPASASINPPS